MRTILALATAAGLAVAPQAGMAATPVEVTYTDAVRCAALDTTLAIVLTADESNISEDDQKAADYFSNMADTWLGQASAANPGGQDATLKDIVDRSTAMLAKLGDDSDKEAQAAFTADMESCTALEEAAYGGPNGVVD